MQTLKFDESQGRSFIFAPEDEALLTKGIINKETREKFFQIFRELIDFYGVDVDLGLGLSKYIARIAKKQLLKSSFHIAPLEKFLSDLKNITGGKPIFKGSSFNYITEDKNLERVLAQIIENAKFMIELLGVDFFKAKERQRKSRASFFVAEIPGTDLFLSCKPGSGASTFSLDFAIGIEKEGELPGELWRAGIDTEMTSAGRAVRIIRTGSGVKKDDPAAFQRKRESYHEFSRTLKISPQRVLTFLCMHLAYDLGAVELKALSTQGAKTLSSLSLAKHGYRYSEHFQSIGLKPSSNPNWFHIPDFQKNFHVATVSSNEDEPGLRNYEEHGLDRVLTAFGKLKNPNDERACPLVVCGSESRLEIARAMIAAGILHKRFGWEKGDLEGSEVMDFYDSRG